MNELVLKCLNLGEGKILTGYIVHYRECEVIVLVHKYAVQVHRKLDFACFSYD